MTLTQAAKEALWLKRFISNLGFPIPTMVISGNNQGSLALANNSVFHARSEHIDIQHPFIRTTLKSGEITLNYIPTSYMVADIMTKPLPKGKNIQHSFSMGAKIASSSSSGEEC